MGINVLSCFDGISVGQLALQRAGIEVDNYFASEIDKYAIAITQKNFPNTIQLGDIECWKNWNLPKIDLLIAGSPCQGFSNAGLGLNFEDPRSKLFFVFCYILAVYYGRNPDLKYILENVKMKKEWRDVITDKMKVEPVLINSALVSAQNRQRLYWANWEFPQPEDRFIFLKDIIEDGCVDRKKSYAIDANYYKGGSLKNYREKKRRQIVNLPTAMRQSERRLIVKTIAHGYVKEDFVSRDKYPSLVAQDPSTKYVIEDRDSYRKLYPVECERLQTMPDQFTEFGVFGEIEKKISNTQRYKCIGNSWTADVVAHILSFSGL